MVLLLALPANAEARLTDEAAWFEAGRVAVNWAWAQGDDIDADTTVSACPSLSPNRRACRVTVALTGDVSKRCTLTVVVARRRIINGHIRSYRCEQPRRYIPPWGDGP